MEVHGDETVLVLALGFRKVRFENFPCNAFPLVIPVISARW